MKIKILTEQFVCFFHGDNSTQKPKHTKHACSRFESTTLNICKQKTSWQSYALNSGGGSSFSFFKFLAYLNHILSLTHTHTDTRL